MVSLVGDYFRIHSGIQETFIEHILLLGTMLDTENMKMKDNLFELKEVIENKVKRQGSDDSLLVVAWNRSP